MAFRAKQHKKESTVLCMSLQLVSAKIYQSGITSSLEEDRIKLQGQISRLEDTIWEWDNIDYWDKQTVIEGKMCPEFLHLEDNKYKMEPISYLECDSRPFASDEEILQGLHSFYTDLYSACTSKGEMEILHFLDQLAVPKIPEDQIESLLLQSIIEQEVLDAINKI